LPEVRFKIQKVAVATGFRYYLIAIYYRLSGKKHLDLYRKILGKELTPVRSLLKGIIRLF